MSPVNNGNTLLESKDSDYVFHFTGGWDGSGYLDTILRYNSSTDTWTEAGQMTEPKVFHELTTVPDISLFNDCT